MKTVSYLEVKVKKLHPEAVVPTYAKNGDAGLDLTAVSREVTEHYTEYDTSLAFEIPEGYVGLVFPRSSISKTGLVLKNSVGVIDSGYRGSVKLRFSQNPSKPHYNPGDKVGQLIIIPYPLIQLIESEELSDTERGDGGFGSSGR